MSLKLLEAQRAHMFAECNECYDYISKYNADRTKKSAFLTRAVVVEGNYEEFKSLVSQIEEMKMKEDETYEPNFQVLKSYNELLGCIRLTVQRLEVSKEKTTEAVIPESPKLPHLELPGFDGNMKNWTIFHETFLSIIHNNVRLTDDQRVQYLLSKLSGSALTVCSGIPPIGSNYQTIWNLLVDRYEDKRALASSYIDQIIKFKPIKSNDSKVEFQAFIDQLGAATLALQALNIENLAEFILYSIACKKLDAETGRQFETSILKETKMPSFNDLLTYVKNLVRVMERTEGFSVHAGSSKDISRKPRTHPVSGPISKPTSQCMIATEQNKICVACKKASHALYHCAVFKSLEPKQRVEFVKANKFCFNCLSDSHLASVCKASACRLCGFKHNTLLHLQSYSQKSTPPESPSEAPAKSSEISSKVPVSMYTSNPTSENMTTVLLSTAKVAVRDVYGQVSYLRMLLDSGSMSHFITHDACTKLGIKIKPVYVDVSGIGGKQSTTRGITDMTFTSRFNPLVSYTLSQVLVVDKITDGLPLHKVDISQIPKLDQATLSDDEFHTPGPIDGLIGSELFSVIMGSKKVDSKLGSNLPIIFESQLGDIVMGKAPMFACSISSKNNEVHVCAFAKTSLVSLESMMQKFWTTEEVAPPTQTMSLDDKICEEKFVSSYNRCEDGHYSVALPFKMDPILLGDSWEIARKRFACLERKFCMKPDFKENYVHAMREYMTDGHAILVQDENYKADKPAFYMPHHAIVRPDHLTTKTRIVFDISSKTSSGLSLNDVLHTGPTLFKGLFDLLIMFRLFPHVVSADLRKMFLSIFVHPEDRKYQRFLWRESQDQPIQCYEMVKVVFGSKPSPFLAQRVLAQLAMDSKDKFPNGSSEVEQFYMDDYLGSFLEPGTAVNIVQEMISMFKESGFTICKFATNSKEVANEIPSSLQITNNVEWDHNEAYLKVLGIQWNPPEDYFSFKVSIDNDKCTKRNILSITARIFDVLGFVSPFIITLKLLIKELWCMKLDWDEEPPSTIQKRWNSIVSEMPILNTLRIPRHLGIKTSSSVSLISFCDASERALGACVYIQVTSPDGSISANLICAKSKVAPVKYVTIPRLELCAALLLAKLLHTVQTIIEKKYPIEKILCFTDSTVSLSWILSASFKWNTFVSNRVSKIQDFTDKDSWYHVAGTQNPADVLSRGLSPGELLASKLYLEGPSWLLTPIHEWNLTRNNAETVSTTEEIKKSLVYVTSKESNVLLEMATRMSSWRKLIRAVVIVLKFGRILSKGPITVQDLEIAELKLIKALQEVVFKPTIESLVKGKESPDNKLKKLKPFVDDGLLRCGGRLTNAKHLDYEHIHPVILPKNHHIVNLLIDHTHAKNLHTGPYLLTAILRRKYWIIGAKDIIRNRVRKCNICFKTNPKPVVPRMGDLPSHRVAETKAFYHTGVDYAGPFYVTWTKRRGVRPIKAYLCLFVCMATKALHLELASDLTTTTFLAALRRFISRRGQVKNLYMDSGSNFIGLSNTMGELYAFLSSNEFKDVYAAELLEHRIVFHFNPPAAPHFGGLWESQVGCVKKHLKKILGTHILTYEMLYSVLTAVESILNSRPLGQLGGTPEDPVVLTPAHFLMQVPTTYLPLGDETPNTIKLEDRYKMVTQMVTTFWKRYSNEYLSTLQERSKWLKDGGKLEVGMLVIIKSENTPVLSWLLGRVIEVFKGPSDGVVRVALVKTNQGVYKRPAVKLCPLPNQ